MRRVNRNRPSRTARRISAILAFLLTLSTLSALLSAAAIQLLTSETLHENVALDRASIQAQTEKIEKETAMLAEEYGFPEGTAAGAVSREELEELNRKAARWWTAAARTGVMAEEPSWTSEELTEAIGRSLPQTDEDGAAAERAEKLRRETEKTVTRAAVSVRGKLLRVAMKKVGDRINLPVWMTVLQQLPQAAGLASLLLAGLIVLLMSRRISMGFRYISFALGADGLLILLCAVLWKILDPVGMLKESSEILALQFSLLESRMLLQTVLLLAVLFGAWTLGALCRKRTGRG